MSVRWLAWLLLSGPVPDAGPPPEPVPDAATPAPPEAVPSADDDAALVDALEFVEALEMIEDLDLLMDEE